MYTISFMDGLMSYEKHKKICIVIFNSPFLKATKRADDDCYKII